MTGCGAWRCGSGLIGLLRVEGIRVWVAVLDVVWGLPVYGVGVCWGGGGVGPGCKEVCDAGGLVGGFHLLPFVVGRMDYHLCVGWASSFHGCFSDQEGLGPRLGSPSGLLCW